VEELNHLSRFGRLLVLTGKVRRTHLSPGRRSRGVVLREGPDSPTSGRFLLWYYPPADSPGSSRLILA